MIPIHWYRKPPLGTPINRAWVHRMGCVGFWPLWENGGPTAFDIVGGNPGTLNGFASPPTATSGWNPGKDGVALAFDASDDFGNAGNKIDPTGSITIIAKVQSVNPTANNAILAKWEDALNDRSFVLSFPSSIMLNISDNGVNQYTVTTDATFSTGVWYDIAAVFEASVGSRVYVDGVEQAVTPAGAVPSAIKSSTRDTIIGGWRSPPHVATMFGGLMGAIYLLNRALSPAQAKSLHMRPWQMFDYLLPVGVAAAAGLPIPVAMHHYMQMARV